MELGRTKVAAGTLVVLVFSFGCAGPRLASIPEQLSQQVNLAPVVGGNRMVQRSQKPFAVRTVAAKPVHVVLHEWRGDTPSDRLIVLVHGVMSDSRTWRLLVDDLAQQADVVAVDLLGCGESDMPSPKEVGPKGYSPDALAGDILTALGQYLRDREPGPRITLVGHSLGSSTVLRMWTNKTLREKHHDLLEQVDSQVLVTPIDVIIDPFPKVFVDVAKTTDAEWDLADTLGLLELKVRKSIRDGAFDPSRAYEEEAQRSLSILRNPAKRHAAQAMIMHAVPIDIQNERLHYERARQIESGYRYVRPPTLVIWGARDELFPQSMGYKVASQLPDAWLRIVENAKHDLAMERPEDISAEIMRVLDHSDRRWSRVVAQSTR